MALFPLTILLSATLLFLVQPMLARWLLPQFGGGAQVWAACLLFFQTLLLAGYAYAHLLTRFANLKQQRWLHAVFVLMALASLAGLTNPSGSAATASPLLDILWLLTRTVGLPYFVLAATGPLLQYWFASVFPLRSPYRLYALSNLGSFAGLLLYPFLVEPYLALDLQRQSWAVGFVLFSLSMALLLWRSLQGSKAEAVVPLQFRGQPYGYWLALAAAGVVLLLAVTQQITQNIPPVPFLWVIPLALYLLSFSLVFNRDSWYQRSVWLYLFAICLLMALLLYFLGRQFDLYSQLLLYLLLLFSGCMLCHGELARSKPAHGVLTAFYLVLAAGGMLGGILVNLLAPFIFTKYWEFPLVLLAILWLVTLVNWRHQARWQTALALCSGVLFMGVFWSAESWLGQHDVSKSRNFYGSLTVRDANVAGQWQRQLIDGTTSHGAQYLAVEQAQQPLSYYRAGTGVALALQHFLPADPSRTAAQLQGRKVGLVGLGAGALAAYGQAGDDYQFYEINPAVISAAQQHFSYLANSEAKPQVILGDARQVLAAQWQNSGSQQFDLLVLDAFSSDAIPVHLLTAEAMALYWQHLMPDGVLLVHISNNYLDLSSVLRNHAAQLGLQALFLPTAADAQNPAATEWVILSRNQRFLAQAIIQQHAKNWPRPLQPAVYWTDQRSNLFSVLK
ncbi:MAG: fused MFS/spermidine synthase [Alishewanella sp.]|nr:fused MFS/spermidine synthase [Alishewanella sp.]MDP5187459.1 fused MFS/spermidine synthase [Alishewanella sp.]